MKRAFPIGDLHKLINQDGGSSYFSINSFAFADNKGSDNYMK